jgi:hypothetical protein
MYVKYVWSAIKPMILADYDTALSSQAVCGCFRSRLISEFDSPATIEGSELLLRFRLARPPRTSCSLCVIKFLPRALGFSGFGGETEVEGKTRDTHEQKREENNYRAPEKPQERPHRQAPLPTCRSILPRLESSFALNKTRRQRANSPPGVRPLAREARVSQLADLAM